MTRKAWLFVVCLVLACVVGATIPALWPFSVIMALWCSWRLWRA